MGKSFLLHVQLPSPEEKGAGVLSIDRNGEAHFFSGEGEQGCKILAEMTRAKIDFAAANGIMLSGFEPCGFERNGKTKYRYQEWWLAYDEQINDEVDSLRDLLSVEQDEIDLKQACIVGMSKNTERLGNALENCRLLAAQHRSEEWAKHILRFCDTAGVGASPLRKTEIQA